MHKNLIFFTWQYESGFQGFGIICYLGDQINEHLGSPSHELSKLSQTQLFQLFILLII